MAVISEEIVSLYLPRLAQGKAIVLGGAPMGEGAILSRCRLSQDCCAGDPILEERLVGESMKRSRSFFLGIALSSAIALVLSACSSTSNPSPVSARTGTATQAPNGKGTEFDLAIRNHADRIRLVDQTGTGTSLGALKGKYVVLAPFSTNCREVCPMVSGNFGRLSVAITKAGLDSKVALVELTVDPETDTPARLSAYQNIFGTKPNWSFYTGRTADVSQVLGAFGIAFEKKMLTSAEMKIGTPDWLTGKIPDHDISHQDVVIIVGPDGNEKWLEEGLANTEGNPIPGSLNKYLTADGQKNLKSPDPLGSWTVTDVLAELSKLGGFKFD